MARSLNRLTDLQVRKLKDDGWYADGGGLYLRVSNGRKRWVFKFELNGKRGEMGLGAADVIKLSDAREARDAARRQIAEGKNPLEGRRLEEERKATEALIAQAQRVTFADYALSIADDIAPPSPKVRGAWISMMTKGVGELAQKAPAEITTEDVMKALKRKVKVGDQELPYWVAHPEAGFRMRLRIEKLLDSANAAGKIPDIIDGKVWKNPARWEGHLEHLLSAKPPHEPHASMHYDDAPAFMERLRGLERPVAKLLEFVILTCVRNGEARGATWKEIDFDHKVWVIPKARTKMRRDHVIPLGDRAWEILEALKPADPDPDGWIFWSEGSRTGIFSENACQDLMNDLGYKGQATTHGFRATFKTWATEETTFQREMIELCLAHKVMKGAEGSYWRGDALEKRLEIYKAWEKHLSEVKANDNVVRPKFRRKA